MPETVANSRIQQLIDRQVAEDRQIGVQVCAYQGPDVVVDAVAGCMGPDDPRPVHNSVTSKFRFENGTIREHHDECDFWNWFEQAMGAVGRGARLFDFLESKAQQATGIDLLDIENKMRAAVKEKAQQKIDDFIQEHPEYAD